MDILTSPTSGSTSSSCRITLHAGDSPPGTSTSGSNNNDRNERQLADSDSHAEMESILSSMEETISRMETKICALHSLNQKEKEGREALQKKCRELEVAVRDREGEVVTLKHRLEESEQDRERVMQELKMQNPSPRTENDISTFDQVVEEMRETSHDVYVRSGRRVHSPTGPWQALPPAMEQTTDLGSSIRQPPLRQQTSPDFIGGFAWK